MSVLIGYATEHGSTRSVAERIAGHLDAPGRHVELLPFDRVPAAAVHEALVIGSAVHQGAWLPDAVRFVRDHHTVLAARPVWMFSVGMTAALRGPARRLASRSEQPKIEALRRQLSPRDYHCFSGVIRPEHLDRTGRIVFRLLGCRYGDFRDWSEVDAWAARIAQDLPAASADSDRPAKRPAGEHGSDTTP
ncbi:flavodoxin domain-containing protein [Streptomyces varsoviensis]|uniref:flavodoxin domain-containing protein n=1 Tax=Streptomyces varsoviensis TaxID=67373 RepID=UPI0007C53129|nr:flavodoxin domain-containing protein [Streptomyces varsoviensis]